MVAEGQEKDLVAFAEEIRRQMEGFIRKTDITTEPATGEFSGFIIRH